MEVVKADIAGLKTDIAKLKIQMQEVKTDIIELKAELQIVKRDVAELKTESELVKISDRDTRLYMENTMEPQLKLLAENYMPSAKKYEKEAAQIGQLWVEIDILKKVVSEHSLKLQMLG